MYFPKNTKHLLSKLPFFKKKKKNPPVNSLRWNLNKILDL